MATMAELFAAYDHLLTAYPIATRVSTASCLAILGDALAQRRERLPSFDARRSASIVAVEVSYRGLFQQPIFEWIIETYDGSILQHLFGLPTTTPLLAALEQVIFNQFIVSPGLYYPLYFGLTGPIQGLTVKQTLSRARANFATLFGCNLCFWLPTQLVQFLFVPSKYKVPFICVASLLWNMILSAMAGSVSAWRGTRPSHDEVSPDDDTPPKHAAFGGGAVSPRWLWSPASNKSPLGPSPLRGDGSANGPAAADAYESGLLASRRTLLL